MLLNIHDKNLNIVGVLDNEVQDAINYGDDKWTRTLETGSSVYEFTAYNKNLSYENIYDNPFNLLVLGNYVSFTYNGKDQIFKIMSTERTGDECYVYSENLNLELRNEMVGSYDSGEELRTIEEHISKMKLLDYTNIVIGVNELSGIGKVFSSTTEETKLSRLLSLLSAFGAEHEFTTTLNSNGKIKEFRMDIFKERSSDGTGGVGKVVEDIILRKGENIKSLKEKQDILEIFNMTVPKGTKTVTRVTNNQQPTVNDGSEVIVRSNMVYSNGSLSIENIQTILKLCYEYRLLPSGVISQLYLESFWGNSNVARVDNNWSGMTWTGNGNRPSGVVVTQGSARPANEGGYYMHFASMSDFFKDWFYLLAKQGIYNVANKNDISEYTKGLFRIGGATYDYAAAGYDHYNQLMTSIRNGVNANNNNVLDTYDEKWRNPTVTTSTTTETASAPNTKNALSDMSGLVGQTVGNGQCYGLVSWYSNRLGGAGLGAGIGGLSGLVGSGVSACDIGTDYNWGAFGWGVEGSGFSGSTIVAGVILNIKPNYGSPWWTGQYGHTLVVESVNGDTVTVLQQNANGRQYVTRDKYSMNAIIPSIQTLVNPHELAVGGRVDGGNAVVKVDNKDVYVNVDLPDNVETTEETVEFYIPTSQTAEYYDSDGNLEFYIKENAIYAPQSANAFPTAFTSIDSSDKWIRRDFTYEVDSVEELIEKSLEDLKANCYPTLDYEIEGFFDAEIGDTFLIEDDSFQPPLTVRARVISQEISHADRTQNTTTLSNFTKLKSEVPDSLTSRLQALLEQSLPYEIRVTASNGTSFKNNTGQSTISLELLKSGITQEANFIFKSGDSIIGKGSDLTVKATDFEEVLNVTIEAYVSNTLVATQSLTFTDTVDGEAGADGSDGVGVDSTVIDYASSSSPTNVPNNWTESIPTVSAGNYLWTRTVWNYTDSTVKTGYSVAKMGENGEAGKTTYPHWAYADNSTGTQGFSLTDGTNKQYQGFYSDFNQTASTDPTKYTWVDRTANVQVDGVNKYIAKNSQSGYLREDETKENLSLGVGNPLNNDRTSEFIAVSSNQKITLQFWSTPTRAGAYNSYRFYSSDKTPLETRVRHENSNLNSLQYFNFTVKPPADAKFIRVCQRFFEDGKIMFENSTVPSDYSIAPEDLNEVINNKADSGFTIGQLNALKEAQALAEKELEAKALKSDFESLYQEYLDYVNLNNEQKEQSEQEMITLANRIISVINDLNDTKERWNFLDTYMEAGEEGLAIGQKDGSAQIKLSDDRISMFSNGEEVMYITQSVLHIENGIFTKTLQIGNFRFESLDDGEILALRYLGG